MAGDLTDALEKCAGQVTNLMIGKWAVANRMPQARVAPFPVWREDRDEVLQIGGVMIKAGAIGVSEGLIDMEPNVAGAPAIIKTHIEKVRAQPQLENDADLVELVPPIV